jgi:hypothetical protein
MIDNLIFKATLVVIGGVFVLISERIIKTRSVWNSHN